MLPEKWAILRTRENAKEINDWMNKTHYSSFSDNKGYMHSWIVDENNLQNGYLMRSYSDEQLHPEATIITIEQFRELYNEQPTELIPQIFN